MVCNIFSCYFGGGATFEGCTGAWIMMILLFFICAIAGKFIGESVGGFNKIGCISGGLLVYILVFLFSCSAKWAFLAGIVGMLAGGFVLGMFLGGEE